jgi:hypothetical protein
MDIEQLKLILETVQGIAGDAKTTAIWWMALHYGLHILNQLLIAGVVITVAVIVARTVMYYNDDEKFIKEIRDGMGLGYGYLCQSDRVKTHNAIRKIVAAHKAEKYGTDS